MRSIIAGRGPLGRLADLVRFPYSETEIPTLQDRGGAARRIVIGPTNSAGQGHQWARAVERADPNGQMTSVRIGSDRYLPKIDVLVPNAVQQRSTRWRAEFESFLRESTHVIWESGQPLLGRRFDQDPQREIEELGRSGVKCALLFHGSDIRPPDRHARENVWSPYRDDVVATRRLSRDALRNAQLVATVDVPTFVSTPDLLQWLPGATWCPVVVDPVPWQSVAEARQSGASGRLVVVHAPTSAWLKGTDQIEPVLRRLDAEGVIEYRTVSGVPHASMPEFYATADVVLDQFRLGIYGVAVCEALAAGRVVMGHVSQFTRDRVRELSGLDLPVHEATIDSLERELRAVAADPAAFEPLRSAGPGFVRDVHDGRRAAQALSGFLGLND